MAKNTDLSQQRFERYLDLMCKIAGHADRCEPLRDYLSGLCLPGGRKSIEPMAARIDPRHVSARHQSMHHFVANAEWDDTAVLRLARNTVLEAMERHGAVAGWVIDDTAIPKKGKHSVGVARQYCGVLGKRENCQVAVSLTLANKAVSVPASYRLYLPEAWAKNSKRCLAAGVPQDISFQTKWQIALDMVVGISSETTVWPPGMEPLPPKQRSKRGRPPSRIRRSASRQPANVLDLATHAPENMWSDICWREGTRGKMRSRFLCLRVRAAHRDENRHEPRPVEWFLAEWPRDEAEPKKFWLSTMPADTPPEQLMRLAKLRWRIERDYEELKGSFGLEHYEGRGWRGFHHHGSLCIAAYAFLAAERARLPLLSLSPSSAPLAYPRVSSRGDLPVRPERHVPSSIETLYRILAGSLLASLSCAWCGRSS